MPGTDATLTVGRLLAGARRRLAAAPFRPATREALLLLGRVLGRGEAELLAHPEAQVARQAAGRFGELLERRLGGEPIAYILGEREFYGRAFHVDPRVLIPRPETEHLVEAVLELDLPRTPRVLDLGTGSGCLAVTLARELPAASQTAVDLSPAALAVARRNARRHAARVALVAGDLAAALRLGGFDLVVANPPYLGAEEAPALSVEVRDHEPAAALFAPGAALSLIERLTGELGGLPAGAALAFEIGAGQAAAVERRLGGSPFRHVGTVADYAGIPRVVVTRRR